MKTILHLIETSGPGGAEKMLISMVEGLDKGKYKSIVCLLKEGWLYTQLQKSGTETIVIPQVRTADFRWIRRVAHFIRTREVDLMHAHEFVMNTYSSLISFLTGVPCIATVHGKNYYPEKWRRIAAYRFVSKTSKMVAVSEDIKRFLIDRVHIKGERITTVWNGIELSSYRPDDKIRGKMRSALGIDEQQPVIGCVGNLYPVKAHTYLLQALAVVRESFPNIRLLLIGRGKLLSTLKIESVDLDVEDNVLFLGFREDVCALLQAIDIFVLPSISEGLPLSILEAMAARRPVLATNVGGIPEAITDGETGLLVPPRDSQVLAEKILLLLENADLSRRLVESAEHSVISSFSAENMVRRYEELYKAVGI